MTTIHFARSYGCVTADDLARALAADPVADTIVFAGNLELADTVTDVLGPHLARLVHVDLTGVAIRARGAARLANDPRANAIATLDLGAMMANQTSWTAPRQPTRSGAPC